MLLASLMLVLSVFLAACSGDDSADGGKGTDKGKDKGTTEKGSAENAAEIDFPLGVSNDSEAIEDGEMTIAMVADEPFEGTESQLKQATFFTLMRFLDTRIMLVTVTIS